MSKFSESGKLKAVTFSYDDGITQDIRLIELLNKYGLKCTFNLNSGGFSKPDILVRNGMKVAHYKVAAKSVKDIYAGHEVAVHTLTHPWLTRLTDEEVIREVEEDRKALEALVDYEIVGMAYPMGDADARVARLIRENTGVRYSRTTIETDSYDIQENLYLLDPNVYHLNWDRMWEMAEEFVALEPDRPQVFYIWGHSYEMDYDSENWVKLEEFFRFISGRGDIFYGTNAEVLL